MVDPANYLAKMAGFRQRGYDGGWKISDCTFPLSCLLVAAHSGMFLPDSPVFPAAGFGRSRCGGGGMTGSTESAVEQAAIAWLESASWAVKHGGEIAPGEPRAGRTRGSRVVPALVKGSPKRLRAASRRQFES